MKLVIFITSNETKHFPEFNFFIRSVFSIKQIYIFHIENRIIIFSNKELHFSSNNLIEDKHNLYSRTEDESIPKLSTILRLLNGRYLPLATKG